MEENIEQGFSSAIATKVHAHKWAHLRVRLDWAFFLGHSGEKTLYICAGRKFLAFLKCRGRFHGYSEENHRVAISMAIAWKNIIFSFSMAIPWRFSPQVE